MFEHRNLTKNDFLARNSAAIAAMIGQVNAQLSSQYGDGIQPLTPQDFWLVFQAEAAIDRTGHVDPNGRHSQGERGVLPLPSNVRFWNGPGAPDPKRPHPLDANLSQYALYLGQLKNKVVRQRGGRNLYPGLFRHPGIDGNSARMAKLLAGVVHGYFFGGNYSSGRPPDGILLDGYAYDQSVADMLRNTTYVHAGTSILESRQRNLDAALEHFNGHNRAAAVMLCGAEEENADGLYGLTSGDTSGFSNGQLRLDVDGPQALGFLSLEVTTGFPQTKTHIIGRVSNDSRADGVRRIEAVPIYQHGSSWLIQSDQMLVILGGGGGAKLQIRRGGQLITDLMLMQDSGQFDKVEFEVDVVDNAGRVTEIYDPHSHPNRPASLPASAVSIERAFRNAGFDVSMSAERSVIPVESAGENKAWSDMELHNAMQTFWSRFDSRAQWGMWVIYAALHERGTRLGGIMFDTLGQQHRQGTAIFTDSFISQPPFGETHPDAWRKRMQMWTAVHEIGHGFNLAHSWQKEAGIPFPLTARNEPEARSFMNYPDKVSGGQEAFFSDFEYRFSERELFFMRHAPRDFVRMGGALWGQNHGLSNTVERPEQTFRLELRPNRKRNVYAFLEPANLELKLTNISSLAQNVPLDVLEEGHHVSMAVAHEGTETSRRHRPFKSACYDHQLKSIAPGQSIYGTHFVGASVGGWLIDEPGFYAIQAAVSFGGETYVSNLLRIYVSPVASAEAHMLAPDFFDENVGRVLAFHGAPELDRANDTLREVVERLPDAPVAQHARLGLAGPQMRKFKKLEADTDSRDLRVKIDDANLAEAETLQSSFVKDRAEATAETLGHIQYRSSVEKLASSLASSGDIHAAVSMQEDLIGVLESRKVLDSVIKDCRSTLRVYQALGRG